MRTFLRLSSTGLLLALLAACGGNDSLDVGDGNGRDIGERVLEQNGIDVDDLVNGNGDVDLGDLEDLGNLDDILNGDVDLSDLDELQENAEDLIDSFSNGSGEATVTIGGEVFRVDGATCFVFGEDLNLEGTGVAADGQPFWVDVSYTVNSRDEMLEVGFDEAMLDSMFGDREQWVDMSVSVEPGKTSRFEQAPDGNPEYDIEVFADEPFFGDVSYERTASGLTGAGDMVDNNGVVLEFGEFISAEFEVTCS